MTNILVSERIPPEIRNVRWLLSLLLFSFILEVLTGGVRQEKQM